MKRRLSGPLALALLGAVLPALLPAAAPARADAPFRPVAKTVAAGEKFTLVIAPDGRVHAAGESDTYGALPPHVGTPGTPVRLTTLTPLDPLPSGRPAVAVAAGSDHAFVLDDEGAVYAAGRDLNGQIGNGAAAVTPGQWHAVEGLPAGVRAADVLGLPLSTVVLGTDGGLYGTGLNKPGARTSVC